MRPRPGRDLLWRAVLAGSARIVDATAGLGADAFHLAAKGAEVAMIERSPILVDLLADALNRAAAGELGERAQLAAQRLTLVSGDAREVLAEHERLGKVEVVYLDPMFPRHDRRERSLPGKGMAALRDAVGVVPTEDESALLTAARAAARRRVVVKRPLGAEPLAGVRPSGSLSGSTTRYDIYAPLPRPPTPSE